jgi:hypothetical protein
VMAVGNISIRNLFGKELFYKLICTGIPYNPEMMTESVVSNKIVFRLFTSYNFVDNLINLYNGRIGKLLRCS